MSGINAVAVSGTVCGAPRLLGGGVLRIPLAYQTREHLPDGTWADGTSRITCVAFGTRAQALAGRLSPGTGLVVQGRLRGRDWIGGDGSRHYETEVIVTEAAFTGRVPPQEGVRGNESLAAQQRSVS